MAGGERGLNNGKQMPLTSLYKAFCFFYKQILKKTFSKPSVSFLNKLKKKHCNGKQVPLPVTTDVTVRRLSLRMLYKAFCFIVRNKF